MAARWGTGEEMLKACNTPFFSSTNLEEAEMLQGSFVNSCLEFPGDALEALHGSLDPSILSIFEDGSTGGVRVIDEESEATLLTALTEILDNVDDENLSPFDTLPDSDLFTGHKGQDHSPLRKLFTLSPAESVLHTRQFPGKNLQRMQKISFQNSEGEEEEDGDTSFLTPIANIDFSLDELDWSLPVSLEPGGEGFPVTFSDLIKQMHPYCMTLCVEGEEGKEHLLPEGGLVLEVVDKGEHGEPILAIPDINITSYTNSVEDNQMVSERTVNEPEQKHEEEPSKMKLLPRENKKSILAEVEHGVLATEPQKKKGGQKKKVTFSPLVSSAVPQKPKQEPLVKNETIKPHEPKPEVADVQPGNKPLEKLKEEKLPSNEEPQHVSQHTETKPKPLSLQQYRLLRQQKKPDPAVKLEDNSTKWPKLPEAPRELTPIPCLPTDSNHRDPRKTFYNPVKMDAAPVIMPAWHPRGPAAPPTPEALLVPPASLMGSSRKPVSSKTAPPGQSSPQESPAAIDVQQNTIQSETSAPLKKDTEVPPTRISSLPTSTESGASSSPQSVSSGKECLNQTSDSDHAVLPRDVPSKPLGTTTQVQSTNCNSPKSVTTEAVKREDVLAPGFSESKNTLPANSKKLTSRSQPHVAPIAAQPFFTAQVQARVVKLAEQMRIASSKVLKSSTVELIESFTSEIGIEAADLTSLLEQFEESQSKEEPCVPEVSGRAAAVGNSSFEEQAVAKAPEKNQNHDLGSTAGITPPATPPHQMWKPIAPVSLLDKNKKTEAIKQTPNKAIQIEPRPLPSNKHPRQTPATIGQKQPFSLDHDYCLPKEPIQAETGSRWNVKQQPSIVIKTKELLPAKPLQNSVSKSSLVPEIQKHSQPSSDSSCSFQSSVLETPDASPSRPGLESSSLQDKLSHQKSLDCSEQSSRRNRQERGRSKRRYRTQYSSSSDSSSESSRSRSPPRKSSRSFSPPRRRRFSYSSSCSGSWSRSRSRSRSRSSDSRGHRVWRSRKSPNQRPAYHFQNGEETKRRKEKAIEERRVVYVGRIGGSMTRKELKERFSFFGRIEECTVHFRENGDNYGFVTYYSVKDAFNAIENGSKLRKQNEFPFDLCFGGRRQFCRTNYADLDSNREYDPKPTKGKFDALDFDTLLKQAQRNLKR
ncbi:hypothetical protein DNTS_032558 [Danionella cerebrum]|uniref:RRM domain-containing protein n=1 Tax=Danionella cerebrum TaxID=2873325 RepID=A0A553RPQ2_9TELE|nr:hypothetical protein DNTS_032558 [Danionella translucida]